MVSRLRHSDSSSTAAQLRSVSLGYLISEGGGGRLRLKGMSAHGVAAAVAEGGLHNQGTVCVCVCVCVLSPNDTSASVRLSGSVY